MSKTGLLIKEFKIKGQIVEVDQKSTCIYVSLLKQNKDSELEGYEDSKRVGAVIHAMVPSLTLRNAIKAATNPPLRQLN